MSEMNGFRDESESLDIYTRISTAIDYAIPLRESGSPAEALEVLHSVSTDKDFLALTNNFPDIGRELWAKLNNHTTAIREPNCCYECTWGST